jgi:iron complex outermembrane receptor protein
VTYHDLRVSGKTPLSTSLTISTGVNNVFDKDPPVCPSCVLKGYDSSMYDLPGRFWYAEAKRKF